MSGTKGKAILSAASGQSDLLLSLTELQSQQDEACATTLAESLLSWLALVPKLLTLLAVCPAHRCVKVEIQI